MNSTDSNKPILIRDVVKTFGFGAKQRKALHGISLDVESGEVFGFIGPNGAGKSTLINTIMGFIRPDAGEVFIHGLQPSFQKSRQNLGYLPEGPRFYEKLTAVELLMFGGRASGMSKEQVMASLDGLLERLEILKVKNRPIGTYSKGMKQRIGLALALIHDPATLILDEPMSGLDPIGRNLLKSIILELKARGKTVLFSTHILNDVETLCDRIGLIHQGRLLFCDSIDNFMSNGVGFEERFMQLIQNSESN